MKIIGTDGLPGPSGGIRSVADGQWAATFTYPTGAAEALELAKKILIDCATSVPRNVMVPSQRIDQTNAKDAVRQGTVLSLPRALPQQGAPTSIACRRQPLSIASFHVRALSDGAIVPFCPDPSNRAVARGTAERH